MKTLLLLAAAIAGVIAGHFLSGLETVPAMTGYEQAKLGGLKDHIYLSAALTGAAVCLMGFLVKESLYKMNLSVMLVGTAYIVISQVLDAGTHQYIDDAVLELLVPFIGVSTPVVTLIYGIGKWLASRTSD